MKLLTDLLKELWVNTKVAAKDGTDLIMFIIIAILALLDISGKFYQYGTVGFIAFYIYHCLIRLAIFKRQIRDLEQKL